MQPTVAYLVPVYASYGITSIALTIWIARTLFKNGAVFLEDVFAGESRMAEAVNKLLQVGFYLVNLGYASLMLEAGPAETAIEAIEVLSKQLGVLLLSLGGMHFFNMIVLHAIRRRAQDSGAHPVRNYR